MCLYTTSHLLLYMLEGELYVYMQHVSILVCSSYAY